MIAARRSEMGQAIVNIHQQVSIVKPPGNSQGRLEVRFGLVQQAPFSVSLPQMDMDLGPFAGDGGVIHPS